MTEASAREAMLAKRSEVIAANPELKYAYELAPLMGVHEREYWNWQLERYFQSELDAS